MFCDVDGAAALESPMADGTTQDKFFVSLVSEPILGLRACLALVSLLDLWGPRELIWGLEEPIWSLKACLGPQPV